MKLIKRLFFIAILLVGCQTGSVSAQVGSAANLVGHGVLALVGGGRAKKQEKLIEQSTKPEKISGTNVMVLRVNEADIKSKAKANIVALQNRLDQYNALYKNNQPIAIAKNDSDLAAIQNLDENWPTDNYASEIRAYKRYAFQQKQNQPAAPVDTSNILHTTPVKKDTSE